MRGIDDLDVAGRRVLVRSDLNVPLDGDRITDDGRVRASVPTIEMPTPSQTFGKRALRSLWTR